MVLAPRLSKTGVALDSAFGPKFAESVAEWMAAKTVQDIFVSICALIVVSLREKRKISCENSFSVFTMSSFLAV